MGQHCCHRRHVVPAVVVVGRDRRVEHIGTQFRPILPRPLAYGRRSLRRARLRRELKELTSDFKQGLITREEFDKAKAALNARFAVAA